jgi:two-component system, OmpR family, response regulator
MKAMPESKILVVEDDNTLREALRYNLEKEGYSVLLAKDGGEALDQARAGKPDLMLLDLMLPVMGGLEVCRVLRSEMQLPVIMLTAKTEEVDKVVGLEMGADDYVTKPFSMRELHARIKAVLRRSGEKNQGQAADADGEKIQAGNIEIDTAGHSVRRGGMAVELGPKEFELLVYLVINKGQVMSREQILHKVWGYEYIGNDRTVDVHMRWLRQKLEADAENPQHLMTVRGYGYKFQV